MIRRYRQLKNLYKLNEMLGNGALAAHSPKELGRTHDMVDEAQRLHASVYLAKGFVNPNDVDESGRMHTIADTHQTHSHYFVISLQQGGNEEVVATARQIEAEESKGIGSFPMIEKSKVYSRAVAEISSHNPCACVEISGLAKKAWHQPGCHTATLP